jgi:hypothetical protein
METIPKAVIKAIKDCTYDYQLIVWLEGKPYSDIEEDTKQAFSKELAYWKKNTLPSLARSDYVIYIRGKNKTILADF